MAGLSNIFVVFGLLFGAALLGFVLAWLIRQTRIEKLTKLVMKSTSEIADREELINQYQTDRDLLKEEVEQYQEKYNTQVTKSQRLSENIRKNQFDLEQAQEKIANLTEMSLQARQEVIELQIQLEQHTIRQVNNSQLPHIKKGSLSLLGKNKSNAS